LDEVKRRVFLIGNEVEVYCSRDFIASMGISMLYAGFAVLLQARQ